MAQLPSWLAVLVAIVSVQLLCCILTASGSTDDDATTRLPTTTATAEATATAAAAAATPGTAAEKPDDVEDELPDENFTPEQLARAGERLGRLFDEGLDANSDGRVTRAELTAWLSAAARERADKDIEEAWQMYTSYRDKDDNDTTISSGSSNNNISSDSNDKSEALLDWQTFADARAAAAADMQEQQQPGQPSPALQAEVRRAIEEASRETGLDKAGIKVSLPGDIVDNNNNNNKAADGSKLPGQQLALELARDRRRWEAADANGDGRLSRREFAAFALVEPPPASPSTTTGDAAAEESSKKLRRVLALEALERLDSDGDGRASLKEFLVGGAAANDASGSAGRTEDEKNFRNVWDANKDGYLDADEMEKMLATLDRMETVGADGDEESDEEAGRLMKEADTDGDGSLSKAEVLANLATFTGSAATNYGDAVGIHDEL